MLDSETKRRIDTARDILVGKVPDPKSQVEQITIALIYKFMDDMDAKSEELGGTRNFFAGEFARFGWPKLMRSGLGGHEMLNVYAEAIDRMPENPGIPLLFRDIFNNAYLPYRDPETLRAFLKVIDEFTYDHSERLGDAFEYLLSVLGSQGDAGQFRTPRHIIDFIVAVIDPKKNETILDPACGTAGFLISSYKHILQANTDDDGISTLTPDERERLTANFNGYDISPDMVRLSLVNMYLHGFQKPHIVEYDTLTSEERWNEYADVILANPPFMSPKGGIRPHNRFSVKSKRSEVLFVDYMAEHLTPSGRAGIIVPEGIIFQSQNAHKQLRKMLVEDYLVAVVSLPAGVFNPYSGVKTSILILDKALAKRTDGIAFFKVENDGFDLGAQRRPIDQNDLPRIQEAVKEYMGNVGNMDGPVCRAGHGTGRQDGQDRGEPRPSPDESILEQLIQQGTALVVPKTKIETGGEYNLSGERYRTETDRVSRYAMLPFKDVCTLEYGSSLPKKRRVDGPYPVMGSNGISGYHKEYTIKGPAIIVGRKGSAGEVVYVENDCFPIDTTYYIRPTSPAKTDMLYLYHLLKSLDLPSLRAGAGIPGLNRNDVYERYRLPLPPLEVQREIVAEIDEYQRVIDGARAVIDNYRPHIPIDSDWPMVEIERIAAPRKFSVKAGPFGSALKKESYVTQGYKVYGQEQVIRGDATYGQYYVTEEKYRELENCKVSAGDVLISLVGTYGRTLIVPPSHEPGIINPRLMKITLDRLKMIPQFFVVAFAQDSVDSQLRGISHGGTMNILNVKILKGLRLPVPPIETQQSIVAEMETEKELVDANRELITRFEKKIQAAIGRVWGEERHGLPGRDSHNFTLT